MPEFDARARAERFLREYIDARPDASSKTFFEWVHKLTETIEAAEGEAASETREEMMDSAQECAMLRIQNRMLEEENARLSRLVKETEEA